MLLNAAAWLSDGEPQLQEPAVGGHDVSSEVSALLEMLPSSSSQERLRVEAGLSSLLLQAHSENSALKQRLTDWWVHEP